MHDNKESGEKPIGNKYWLLIRKNGFSILLGLAIVIMMVNPDAKPWVLRQLMHTGIFNPEIDKEGSGIPKLSAIDFDFEDAGGSIRNTSSLRGKVVFVNFWASWCPPCRAEFPSIETLYSKFGNNPDIFFLVINEDSDLSAASAYLKEQKFSVPFFTSKGNVPGTIYTGTLPTTLILDKKGEVRFRHEGFANYGSEEFIKQIEELIKE